MDLRLCSLDLADHGQIWRTSREVRLLVFSKSGPGPIALLIDCEPQRASGAGPETGDYLYFWEQWPIPMSTAIGTWHFHQKVPGAVPEDGDCLSAVS